MERWKVVATAVTFGQFNQETVQRLEDDGCEVVLNPYGRPLTNDEMIEFAKDADALIVGNDKVPTNVIEHFENMKIIAKHGVGVDAIDRHAATKKGIAVTNAPGTNKEEVADLTFGFILSIARVFNQTINETKNRQWIKYPGMAMDHKTIGIIGVGNIGTCVAKRATGFSMNILGYDIVEREEAKALGVQYVSLNELLENSDIISLHVPLNDGTYQMLGEQEFKMMKDNVILVNTARSQCIVHEALNQAIESRKLFGYATDVYDFEPPLWQPYFDHPRVLLTPHIGGTTFESNARMGNIAVDNVLALKHGETPPNLITEDMII